MGDDWITFDGDAQPILEFWDILRDSKCWFLDRCGT